ncbi:MAG TPA: allantoicase [Saprospiraceae bacterium]|nr:allantoicase [Saprospiraceae bacterium]
MSEPPFTKLLDLAAERFGGKVLLCSDDFFAEKENLIKPGRGIFIPDKYTDRGKWMDGWESRRKRTMGHDWCIIQLATTGKISGVDIDTNHFLGNHPPHASIDATRIEQRAEGREQRDAILEDELIVWKEILPKSVLNPGSQNFYEIGDSGVYSHLRLNIYPDGGVARLKVYGDVVKDWSITDRNASVDLAAAVNGAKSIRCNDMFFSHMGNLIMPGRGVNMGDGWETKRSRIPGNRDWVVVRLAHKGMIEKIVVDTCHFKGNYPDSAMIEGCLITTGRESYLDDPSIQWQTILPQVKLSADCEHVFEKEIVNKGPFTHVRLTIFPDGGVSRMRLWGRIRE